MSIDDLEDERRYQEAGKATWKGTVFDAPVRSLHVRPAVVVAPETAVTDTVKRMVSAGQGCVLVAGKDGRVRGIFTERDLLLRVVAKGLDLAGTRVEAVMTKDPECLALDDTLGYALHKMTVGEYRSVPVVDDEGRAFGVLTQQEGVKALAALFPSSVFSQPPRSIEQKPPRNQYGG